MHDNAVSKVSPLGLYWPIFLRGRYIQK